MQLLTPNIQSFDENLIDDNEERDHFRIVSDVVDEDAENSENQVLKLFKNMKNLKKSKENFKKKLVLYENLNDDNEERDHFASCLM